MTAVQASFKHVHTVYPKFPFSIFSSLGATGSPSCANKQWQVFSMTKILCLSLTTIGTVWCWLCSLKFSSEFRSILRIFSDAKIDSNPLCCANLFISCGSGKKKLKSCTHQFDPSFYHTLISLQDPLFTLNPIWAPKMWTVEIPDKTFVETWQVCFALLDFIPLELENACYTWLHLC